MFGKTLLSVVALLFAGSQFAYATTTLNACDANLAVGSPSECVEHTTTSASFCIKNTDIIILNDGSVTCKVPLTDGSVNIVKLVSGKYSTISNIAATNISSPDDIKANLAVVDCRGGDCIQVTGILKDSQGFFTVDKDNGVTGAATMTTTKEYVVFDGSSATYYYYNEGTTSYIKKAAGFGDNLCVDADAVIWDRKKALCEATGDCKYYYNCLAGVCTLTRLNTRDPIEDKCNPKDTGRTKCSDGYHITNDYGTELADSGKLWRCAEGITGGCEAVPNAVGYFVNKEDSDKPSILCTTDGSTQTCVNTTINNNNCGAVGTLRETEDGSNAYAICLEAEGTGVELGDVDGQQLMVTLEASASLYGVEPNTLASTGYEATQFSVVLSVDGNNVQLVKESTPVRYKYTNAARDTYPLIYDRTAAQTAKLEEGDNICYSDNTPYEYKLVQWIDAVNNCAFADIYVANEE